MVLPSQTGNLQAAAENSRLGPSLLEQDHNSVQLNLFIVFLRLIFSSQETDLLNSEYEASDKIASIGGGTSIVLGVQRCQY